MPPKVNRACQRCRRLKLKCDAQRPCVLCSRAGASCVAVDSDVWKINQLPQQKTKKRKVIDHLPGRALGELRHAGQHEIAVDDIPTYQHVPSSSTTSLVEEALRQSITTENQPISTVRSQVEHLSRVDGNGHGMPSTMANVLPATTLRGQTRRTATSEYCSLLRKELSEVLPSLEAALLLVKTYFDRIHWFTLLFYQAEFLTRFTALYKTDGQVSEDCELQSLHTALAVCALSLQYLGDYRSSRLSALGVDCEALKAKILEVLGRRLLDIIAMESVEAVQTCVLQGTYYLFHGQPELAWPICGCGLRIAQALKLHRKVTSGNISGTNKSGQFAESRKRCWWAIYDVETFCSMLYGYPLSISDSDCDVDHLDAHSRPVGNTGVTETDDSSNEPTMPKVNLLHYKQLMSRLSVQIKAALGRLYSVSSKGPEPQYSPNSVFSAAPQNVYDRVKNLNSELDLWYREYQAIFALDEMEVPVSQVYTDIEMDHRFGDRGAKFDYHLFQLQRLTLEFAYQNARILVNRPLLWHNTTGTSGGAGSSSFPKATVLRESTALKLCREAALKTSSLGNSIAFRQASKTYAVAFMSMHILTAGVTLCMLIVREPLGQEAPACKVGVHNLMKMQASLRPYSQQAGQGLEILKQLFEQVLKKEHALLFDLPGYATNDIGASQDVRSNVTDLMSSTVQQSTLQNDTSWKLVQESPTPDNGANTVVAQATEDGQRNQLGRAPPHNDELNDLIVLNQAIEQNGDSLFDLTESVFLEELRNQEQGWIWGLDMFDEP